MSAASEARKVLDRAATKFGAGALTTEGDAVAYVNARDALIAAVRAEERARLVAENVKVANGLKAIRELARQVAEFYPEASERIKEAGICIVDEAEHLAALIGADK